MIITLTGPSGIGKGALKARLKKLLHLSEPPVYTTREMRKGEAEGERITLAREDFFRRLKKREFILAQELYGDFYAFHRNAFPKGKAIITEVAVSAAKKFREMFPNAIMVNLTTGDPDFLGHRLRKRGDRPQSLQRRVAAAEREMKAAKALKVFDFSCEVDFENEHRVLQDIMQKLERRVANAESKIVRKKPEKPADSRFRRAGGNKRAPDKGAGLRRRRSR